ncbi:hypothetical protein BDR05DRAFT_967252 [Suillus weaverae]|nr:hypothetical protein BDR05DRAFT_967252 [Suillus weaverae]
MTRKGPKSEPWTQNAEVSEKDGTIMDSVVEGVVPSPKAKTEMERSFKTYSVKGVRSANDILNIDNPVK